MLVYLTALNVVMQCYRMAKVRVTPDTYKQKFPRNRVLMLVTGTAIRLSSIDPLEASPQHLSPPPLQRLLCRPCAIYSHLLLPKKDFHYRKCSVFIWCGHQDESAAGYTRYRYDIIAGFAV